jgi:pSer/pThr/pTyr-binding forkhead associated (FHA) protein
MARLIKMQNGEVLEEFPITKSELRIGRAADNDIILYDETVSSHHAVLTVALNNANGSDESAEQYHIKDLQSTNKTYVNNTEISEQTLKDKDVVRVGFSHFELDLSSNMQNQKDFERTTKIHKSWIPGVFYTKD